MAIVGGGNGGRGGALLAQMCEKVTLIHRRDSLRAEKVMQQRLFAHPKIEVLWDHVIDEVLGTEIPKSVTGVRVRHVRSGETQDLPVEGFFVAIGHDPATAIFRGQLEMDAEGYVVTQPGTTWTSVRGVFAAGDVQDKIYRQAVTAAGSGCMAALDAEKFLAGIELSRARYGPGSRRMAESMDWDRVRASSMPWRMPAASPEPRSGWA